MSGPYRIELLDADGCELSVTEENSFQPARRCAMEKTREACYDDWRQARVLDSVGTCLWDKHRSTPHICRCCGEPTSSGRDCCSDDFREPGEIRETGT